MVVLGLVKRLTGKIRRGEELGLKNGVVEGWGGSE